jgi:hypothetical protein
MRIIQFLVSYQLLFSLQLFQISGESIISSGLWLMFFSASSTEEYFTEINVPYDSEFLLVQSASRNDGLSLTEVYQNHPSRALQRHSVAIWSSAGGFVWSPTSLLVRRGDLHSTVVRVGVPGEVSVASL